MRRELSKAFKKLREQNDFLKERNIPKEYRYDDELDIVETALKDYEKKTKLAKEYRDVNNVMKRLKTLEIIKENLNIDEILLAVKGVCKASDYDLVKEVLENV